MADVPALTSSPPPESQTAPAPSTTSGLGQLNDALKSITDTLTSANQTKAQATDALSQLEQLLGIGKPAAQPAPPQGPSVMTFVLVGALVLLGGVVVWRFVKRGTT